MPQVGAHLVIGEKVLESLGSPSALVSNEHCFKLGSIGPDLALFLFDKAGSSRILNEVIGIYSTISEISEKLEEVEEKVSGPIEDLVDWFTGGVSTELVELVTLAQEALKTAFTMTMLPGTSTTIPNPFHGTYVPGLPQGETIAVASSDLSFLLRRFGHPYTNDPGFKDPEPFGSYKNWWWVDLLHYRKTGPFAEALRSKANGDVQKAYAQGYVTHIAGDVCGHPFVNGVVGGPFRNHVIRHMVLENIIDTWVWDKYKHEDLTASGLERQIDVGDDFDQISELLLATMREVYFDNNIRPGLFDDSLPSRSDLRRAYKLMMTYLKKSTNSSVVPPTPPPGNPAELLEEIGESIAGTLDNIGEAFDSDNEWWEWLLAPLMAALYAAVLIIKLATLPAGVIAGLAAMPMRWLAYLIQVALYDLINNMRWQLALGGWGKVPSSELNRDLSLASVHLPGYRTDRMTFRYPHRQVPHDVQAFWLMDPFLVGTPLEGNPTAECCPYKKHSTPDVFIDGPGFDAGAIQDLHRFAGPLGSPSDTVGIEWATFLGSQLGNSVNFAKMMIEGDYPLASFDLDGDKGYGFLSWDGEPPHYDDDLI